MSGFLKKHLAVFYSEGRISRSLLGIFILINLIVLINACFHEPDCGYDHIEHWKYIKALSKFQLPAMEQTGEFFCPPLPYIFPAILQASGRLDTWWVLKLSQILNFFLSIALTFYFIRTVELIRPGKIFFKIASIGILAMLTVYYKAFAFVRGEPYVAFFSVFVVYYFIMIFVMGKKSKANIIILGLGLGLLALSRQWGVLLFPGVIVFVICQVLMNKTNRAFLLRSLLAVLFISFLTSGWFYLSLLERYGRITAFNRAFDNNFSLSNQPATFYFGLGKDKIFKNPIAPSFPNEFIPMMYSDTWGDYWGYFSVDGYAIKRGNLFGRFVLKSVMGKYAPEWLVQKGRDIGPYLGRVNLLSLFPTAVIIASIFLGIVNFMDYSRICGKDSLTASVSFLVLLVFSSLAGYFWFLIMYPSWGKGDTIKGIYMIQIFPFLSILAGNFMQHIKEISLKAWKVIMVLFVIIFIHNLPAMLSRIFW